uniref:Uncharacterized protein n=1 Tax=Arundo donax TaxID=35708 RepID=A0A0A9BGB9_ARUDO
MCVFKVLFQPPYYKKKKKTIGPIIASKGGSKLLF